MTLIKCLNTGLKSEKPKTFRHKPTINYCAYELIIKDKQLTIKLPDNDRVLVCAPLDSTRWEEIDNDSN